MISCTLYTPERINPEKTVAKTPLELFKEIPRSTPNPVIYDRMFFLNDDDDFVYAYDEKTGDELWKSDMADLRMVLPIIQGGRVLVEDLYTNNGVFLSLRDGKFIEKIDKISASAFPSWCLKNHKLFYARPSLEAEISSEFYCRQGGSFTVAWKYNGFDFPFGHYAVSEDYILIKDTSGYSVCLNHGGEELWRLSPLETGLFGSQSEIDAIPDIRPGFSNLNRALGYPMIYQNRIVVVPMLDNHFISIELTTGNVLWTRKIENSHNWIRQGYCDEVYCLSSDYIEAFSLETGEQTKKVAIDGSYITESLGIETISFTQFAVSETHLFASSSIMQYLSAINIETGKVDWTFNPEEAVTATNQPYVANGRVYYPCLGKMYIFEGSGGYTQVN